MRVGRWNTPPGIFMSITVLQAKTIISEALGGDAEVMSSIEIINAAGETLVNMYEWNWLNRTSISLDTVEDQSYIDLPSAFASLDGVFSSQYSQAVELVRPADMHLWRRGDYGSPRGYVAAVNTFQEADNSLTNRLELYPTPSSAEVGAFTMAYRATWNEVASDAGDAVILTVGNHCQALFKTILIATAKGYEEEDNAGLEARIESIARSHLFINAVGKDAGQQLIVGRIPGTHSARRYGTSHITLADPT